MPYRVHFNEVLFLLTIPKQYQESLSAPSLTVCARQGPLPGQVFSYRYRTTAPDPVLATPAYFIEV